MFNIEEYPYLKDKKEIFESSVDIAFNQVIPSRYNGKYTTDTDFIKTFIEELKYTIYMFYRNNRFSCKTDDSIKSLVVFYLTQYLVSDIPLMEYQYKLNRDLINRLREKGSYYDTTNYEDNSTDKTSSTSTNSLSSTSNREGSSTATSNDESNSLTKNADTPTLSNPSSTFVDTYTNGQQKNNVSVNGTTDTTTSNTDKNTSEGSNTLDKTYTRDYSYTKTKQHEEYNSLEKELETIKNTRNNVVLSYIDKLNECFITIEDLYDLYEGEE